MSRRHLTPVRLPAVDPAPAGVADGDLWLAADGVRARIGGVTVTLEGEPAAGSGVGWEGGISPAPGYWLVPGMVGGLGPNHSYSMGTCVVVPVAFNEPTTIDAVAPVLLYGTSATGKTYCGVYNLDDTFVPTTPVVTWGYVNMSGAGTAPVLTLGAPHTFSAGVWGLGTLYQSASVAQYYNQVFSPYISTSEPLPVDGGGAYLMTGLATSGLTTLPTFVWDGTTKYPPRWAIRCAP